MTGLSPRWPTRTIGEVCEKPQYGWTTKARKDGGAALHLLRTTDITGGSIDWRTVPFCTVEPPEPEKYLLHDGDIVVSRAGSVGVSARIKAPEESVFASYLIRIRPHSDMSADYIGWFFKSPDYWRQVKSLAAGIALQNINAKKLTSITLPVPPLPDQERVVTAIEEQFSRLDALESTLIAALRRSGVELDGTRLQHKGGLRAVVLREAFAGRLAS